MDLSDSAIRQAYGADMDTRTLQRIRGEHLQAFDMSQSVLPRFNSFESFRSAVLLVLSPEDTLFVLSQGSESQAPLPPRRCWAECT